MDFMTKFAGYLLLLISSTYFASCGSTPEELQTKYKDEVIAVSGISFDKKDLNSFYSEMGKGVTSNQFLKSFGKKVDEVKEVKKADIIVDMSAGMNIGIDKSYSIISAIVKRFDPSHKTDYKYYHVDDEDKVLPIEGLNSLADAALLQNPENYKKSYSKIKFAFESASKSSDKITVVITDFLLDEGIKSDRRLKNGKFIKEETADNSTWARKYFTEWFNNGNQLLIYPFGYTAANYYNKNESKYIYYIFFIPNNCSNKDLNDLKVDLGSVVKDPILIAPSSINIKISEDQLTNCVEGYNNIKNNKKASKIFSDLNTQIISLSHPSLVQNKFSNKSISCPVKIENLSPYIIKVQTNSFDISKVYYNALKYSEEDWLKSNINFTSNEIISNTDIENQKEGDSLISFKLATKVVTENYLSAYKGYGKILASRIFISDLQTKAIDNRLSWEFESKYGTMVNNSFKESIQLSLDDFKSTVSKNSNDKATLGSIILTLHDK